MIRVIFGRKRQDQHVINIKVEEGTTISHIQNCQKMKILGVIIDENLTWEHHVKSVKSKTCRTITNLARTTSSLPLRSRRTLYDALVTPHFSYGDVIWDGTTCGLAKDLQKAGNFAAKSLLGLKKRESASSALKKLNMMPLAEKRKVHLGVMTHKLVNSKGPSELKHAYQDLRNPKHGHNTRSAARRDMRTLSHRTSRFNMSTQQRASKLWNEIPQSIRNIESTSLFKRQFQSHLQAIYSSDAEISGAAAR